MTLKSFIKYYTAITLLTCSIVSFATNEQVKCPSVGFVKLTYTGSMNNIIRTNEKEFYVLGTRDAHDENSNYAWELQILANTTQDYDFNSAYQQAQHSLENIMKAENEFADDQGGYVVCRYLETNGNKSLYLSAGKDLKIRK